MNNVALQLKIKQRLNKLDSNDYDNIQPWQMVEAFNKAQLAWCRRQLHGYNNFKEGDEGSKRRIDDLQILLKEKDMSLKKQELFVQTDELPSDYFEWKRIDIDAGNECCDNKKKMVVYLAEEANVNNILRDHNKKPSFEWAETFCTLKGNHIRIYTNGEFNIDKCVLTYYRLPRYVEIKNSNSIYNYNGETIEMSGNDVECEFKDDIAELMIDEAVKIIASDIESLVQKSISENNVELNN